MIIVRIMIWSHSYHLLLTVNIILFAMPSLPARAIILNNTIPCDFTELPSMNKTYTRYNESVTNLSAARNREKVLTRRIDKEKKEYLRQKGHNKANSYTREITDIEKLIISLHSKQEKRLIDQKLEDNARRRERTKKNLSEVKEKQLAHKSSIYRFVEKMKAENEQSVQLQREKELKLKEIQVMKQRMREKKRAYNILEFYQTKMDNLKKHKEQRVEALMTEVSKNGEKIDEAIKTNVKLNLKHEKSVNRIEKYRTTAKRMQKPTLVNPQ